MADDVSYGDISAYGHATFKTPHIDKLAAQGQHFTSGYCSASTCTPTRYSLPIGITLRDTLKMNWTHGHNSTIHNGINRIGFYSGGHTARFRDENLDDKWVEKSREFIAANKDKPFFLFFASHDNHVPRIPHERFRGKSGTGLRGDSVIQLDWCVGEIMAALEEHGLTENTLVGFRSDDWKLIRRTNKYQQPARITKRPIPELKALHTLYFLPDDPAERKDVSKENPEMLKEMIERLDAIIAAGRTRS